MATKTQTATTTLETSVPDGGKGGGTVKLGELEHLRKLVHQQLGAQLSTDILLDAMIACGNQVRDTYKLLKERYGGEEAGSSALSDPADRKTPSIETPPKKRRSYAVDCKVTPNKKRKNKSVAVSISRILGATDSKAPGSTLMEVIDVDDETENEPALVVKQPETPIDCAKREMRALVDAKAQEEAPSVAAMNVSAVWEALRV